jgi:hypothetical protein
MVYSYNRILLSNKNKCAADICNNVFKSQNHFGEWKNTEKTNMHTVWVILYKFLGNGNPLKWQEAEHQLPGVGRSQGKRSRVQGLQDPPGALKTVESDAFVILIFFKFYTLNKIYYDSIMS